MESTKTCPSCGYQVSLEKPFCPNCGTKFAAETADTVVKTETSTQIETASSEDTLIRCSRCGAKITSPDGVCQGCGNKMILPAVAPISEPTNKCHVCGKEVPRACKFCTACGADMSVFPDRAGRLSTPPKTQNPFMQPGGTYTPAASVITSCRFCGSPINANSSYCPKCGNNNLPNSAFNVTPNVPVYNKQQNSGLTYGILAIVFGILGGWLAIVMGIAGISAARKSGNTAALVCSIIGLCLSAVSIFFWMWVLYLP